MTHPIIVIGGGLAGASLALALSHQSHGALPVALVEASDPQESQQPDFDTRAIALAHRSCQHLASLGLWTALGDDATAIRTIQISEQGRSGLATLRATDHQLTALGQVVPAHCLRQQLARRLAVAPGVRCYCPAQVVAITPQAQRIDVRLDSGVVLQGSLLVAATGSESPLLTQLAVRYQTWDYQQYAIIANVVTTEPHQGRAFERFTTQGPLALLPAPAGGSAMVWCQATAQQPPLLALDDDHFLQRLQQAFGWRLGALLRVGRRDSYPLRLRVAERRSGHRWVLAGNAAQTLHPIAGQGFNLALQDVMTLATHLSNAWQQQCDLGSYTLLARYSNERQQAQQQMVAFTNGLLRLFGNNSAPAAWGRNIGLRLFDSCSPIKNRVSAWLLGLQEIA